MFKFFRKYRTWILAVGGSLLMVTFLLGSMMSSITRALAGRRTIATYVVQGSEYKFKNDEMSSISRELQILEDAFPGMVERLLNLQGLTKDDPNYVDLAGVPHWFLLHKEAELAGFIGGVGDAEAWLQQQAGSVALGPQFNGDFDLALEYFQNILAQGVANKGTYRDGLEALASYIGIERLIQGYYNAPTPSDGRLQHYASQFLDQTLVASVFIDASTMTDDLPEPSDAELQEHFETYRDVEPGEGQYGLGYRLPDRLKFESIKVDFESVLDQITVTGLDARVWYDKNRDFIPLERDQTEPPAYEVVSGDARDALRREKAEKQVAQIIKFVKARFVRSTRPLAKDGDYRILPNTWNQDRVNFETLRQEIEEQFNVKVTYEAVADQWIDLDNPVNLGDVGSASRSTGATQMPFAQVLRSLRSFDEVHIPGLQAGLADFEPLRNNDRVRQFSQSETKPGNVFFYRVLEVDPARPAATIEEVGPVLAQNVQRIHAFLTLVEQKDMWVNRSIEDGLDVLAGQVGSKVSSRTLARIDRNAVMRGMTDTSPVISSEIGVSVVLSDAIMAYADSADLMTPIEDIPVTERTLYAPVPDKLGIAIARVNRVTPMSKDGANGFLSMLQRGMYTIDPSSQRGYRAIGINELLIRSDFGDDAGSPFSFLALRDQFQYESIRIGSDDPDSEDGMSSNGEESEAESDSEQDAQGG